MVVRRPVGRPATNLVDLVKKACSARSLEIKDTNLSARIEWKELVSVMNAGITV